MVTSGSIGGLLVGALTENARDVGFIPSLGAIFPICITLIRLVAMTWILYMLYDVWSLKLPGGSLVTACMDVIVSIKGLRIPW